MKMGYSKKTDPRSIRLPKRTRRLIEEEADKHTRGWQDETLVLIAEALHNRQFNIKNYV
jgi:hypothetical protein